MKEKRVYGVTQYVGDKLFFGLRTARMVVIHASRILVYS